MSKNQPPFEPEALIDGKQFISIESAERVLDRELRLSSDRPKAEAFDFEVQIDPLHVAEATGVLRAYNKLRNKIDSAERLKAVGHDEAIGAYKKGQRFGLSVECSEKSLKELRKMNPYEQSGLRGMWQLGVGREGYDMSFRRDDELNTQVAEDTVAEDAVAEDTGSVFGRAKVAFDSAEANRRGGSIKILEKRLRITLGFDVVQTEEYAVIEGALLIPNFLPGGSGLLVLHITGKWAVVQDLPSLYLLKKQGELAASWQVEQFTRDCERAKEGEVGIGFWENFGIHPIESRTPVRNPSEAVNDSW